MKKHALLSGCVLLALVAALSCQKPLPPVIPGVPSGPTSASPGVTCTYRTSATDPEGDEVCCRLDWGDGNVSPWSRYAPGGTDVAFSRVWDSAGAFSVKAQARDETGLESDWSAGLDVAVGVQNQPPANPGTPEGPSSGLIGTSYDFRASATDPEGDSIAIRFDWGWKGIQTPPHSGQDIPYTGGKSEVHFSGTLSY